MTRFDGLRQILGHADTAADSSDMPTDAGGERANETAQPSAPADHDPHQSTAATGSDPGPAEDLDDPSLLDLDRGVYNDDTPIAGHSRAEVREDLGFRAGGRSPDDPSLLELDSGVFDDGPSGPSRRKRPTPRDLPAARPQPSAEPPRARVEPVQLAQDAEFVPGATTAGHVNHMFAALVLILSAVLGASAAVALFHDRVSRVLAHWL